MAKKPEDKDKYGTVINWTCTKCGTGFMTKSELSQGKFLMLLKFSMYKKPDCPKCGSTDVRLNMIM